MKIGIFGDSFAQPNKLNPTDSWVDILSFDYDVTNHAVSSSNLYYSVDLIKRVHAEYDKIILVVTKPGRLKISNWIQVNKTAEKFIIGPGNLNPSNKNLSKLELAYLEAGNQYYSYLHDDVYDRYIHNLMLKDVFTLRPDIMKIPAFLDSWFDMKGFSMKDIFFKETFGWKVSQDTIFKDFEDLRNCHMTAENNAIFATKAKEWLNDKPVHIDLNDFVTTTNKDFYLKQK